MSDEKMICPKCGEKMACGFVLDANTTDRSSYFTQARWVEGKPVSSEWSGLKWDDKAAYKIAAYRCCGCGLLELHAIDPSTYPEAP
jgi:hypothetical protein